MRFELNFDNKVKTRKATNANVHDDTLWKVVYAYWDEFSDVLHTLPKQFAIHHMYELLNKPWRNDKENVADFVKWLGDIRDLKRRTVNQ